jgi:hypothetical protein
MPAVRAIASVEAPSSPLRANSTAAAATTASRRAAAVWRIVVLGTPRKLALTHIIVNLSRRIGTTSHTSGGIARNATSALA